MTINCLGCKHFVPQASYPAGTHPDVMNRGTCIESPVWQSIGNGRAHRCGRFASSVVEAAMTGGYIDPDSGQYVGP